MACAVQWPTYEGSSRPIFRSSSGCRNSFLMSVDKKSIDSSKKGDFHEFSVRTIFWIFLQSVDINIDDVAIKDLEN